MPLFALLLASQLVATTADQGPTFDIEPACRDSATMADGVQTLQSCENDERVAHEQLTKQWKQFEGPDREMCTDMTKNFDPSYVELLSCLEMMRDAKTPPSEHK